MIEHYYCEKHKLICDNFCWKCKIENQQDEIDRLRAANVEYQKACCALRSQLKYEQDINVASRAREVLGDE